MIMELRNTCRIWKNFKGTKGLNNFNNSLPKTIYQNQIRQYCGPGLIEFQQLRLSQLNMSQESQFRYCRFLSTKSNCLQSTHNPEKAGNEPKVTTTEKLTRAEKLKKAVKEYGSTVIVFHVGISLISLGTCYLLVSAGLDSTAAFNALGLQDWASKSQIAASAGTFAVAYVLHKVFAPVRIAITLGSVPFIVRHLRRIGFLKK